MGDSQATSSCRALKTASRSPPPPLPNVTKEPMWRAAIKRCSELKWEGELESSTRESEKEREIMTTQCSLFIRSSAGILLQKRGFSAGIPLPPFLFLSSLSRRRGYSSGGGHKGLLLIHYLFPSSVPALLSQLRYVPSSADRRRRGKKEASPH